jgi:hypothetical protein
MTEASPGAERATASDFVFNVVMTPGTFRYLRLFTGSLLAQQSGVQLRLVANGCSPEELREMRGFATDAGARVAVLELSGSSMVPHGVALDEIYAATDDGDFFCFVDSDVKATGPFMELFLELLNRADLVTSCSVAWSDDAVLPPDASDLVGRHSIGHDGFVYGSSYLAIYRRDRIEQVRRVWPVTFRAYAYDKLAEPVQRRLEEMGRRFRLYDTAKVLNILLHGDGGVLTHAENPALVHVGGISQYLSDPSVLARGAPIAASDGAVPWFAESGSGRRRWDFARWAAAVLRNIVDGEALPELPDDPILRLRATEVQRELLDLAGR